MAAKKQECPKKPGDELCGLEVSLRQINTPGVPLTHLFTKIFPMECGDAAATGNSCDTGKQYWDIIVQMSPRQMSPGLASRDHRALDML